jgi:ABC-type xylose transport system permease subunit
MAILEGGREGMVIGYLPKAVACWLGPLADIGAIVMTARSVCCLCRECGRDCQSLSTVCACAVGGSSCHTSHARSSSACEGVL